MAGLERMKAVKSVVLIGLVLTLLFSFAACINYLPADGAGSGDASADSTGENGTVGEIPSGEETTEVASDNGDIPNQPEDGYTKFY